MVCLSASLMAHIYEVMGSHPGQLSGTEQSIPVTPALTWENHNCLFNTSGIGVLLALFFKGRGAVQKHNGTWNPTLPFSPHPCHALPPPGSGMSAHAPYAGVHEAVGPPSSSVCCCSCRCHSPLNPANYIGFLSGGHWAGPP